VRAAVHAEWTKIRTVASPRWLLLAAVALTVGPGAAISSVATCAAIGCGGDPIRLSLAGVMLGQAPVAVLAVLVIGGEHRTGLIRLTLTATPGRVTALAAKAVVVTGAVVTAGTVAVAGALLAGRPLLARQGFTAVHGHPALSPTDGATLRASAGTVLYLALIALLSLGIATAVRDSATSIGVVLGLLYLLPVIAQVVGDPYWQRLLERAAPMSAGLAVQATTGLDDLPISPWAGLGITAAWAAAALVAGGLLLRVRDV
jgi:ABC-2 type transport system permease protein